MNHDETRSLAAFCRVCNQLATSTFGRQSKVAASKAYRVQPNTLHSTRVRKFDMDSFRSFLIDFRKLVLAKDPANLHRVLGILGRYGNTTDRQRIRQIKMELRSISDSMAGVGLGIGNQSGHLRFIRPKEVTDAYFNGALFHNNEALADDLEFFRRAGVFAWGPLLHYVVFIHKQALRLAGSIRLRNIV
jgi:transposase InsO family protein